MSILIRKLSEGDTVEISGPPVGTWTLKIIEVKTDMAGSVASVRLKKGDRIRYTPLSSSNGFDLERGESINWQIRADGVIGLAVVDEPTRTWEDKIEIVFDAPRSVEIETPE